MRNESMPGPADGDIPLKRLSLNSAERKEKINKLISKIINNVEQPRAEKLQKLSRLFQGLQTDLQHADFSLFFAPLIHTLNGIKESRNKSIHELHQTLAHAPSQSNLGILAAIGDNLIEQVKTVDTVLHVLALYMDQSKPSAAEEIRPQSTAPFAHAVCAPRQCEQAALSR